MKQPNNFVREGRPGATPMAPVVKWGTTPRVSHRSFLAELREAKKSKDAAQRRYWAARTDSSAVEDLKTARAAESFLDSDLASMESELLTIVIMPVETVTDVGIAQNLNKKNAGFFPSLKVYGKRAPVVQAAQRY